MGNQEGRVRVQAPFRLRENSFVYCRNNRAERVPTTFFLNAVCFKRYRWIDLLHIGINRPWAEGRNVYAWRLAQKKLKREVANA